MAKKATAEDLQAKVTEALGLLLAGGYSQSRVVIHDDDLDAAADLLGEAASLARKLSGQKDRVSAPGYVDEYDPRQPGSNDAEGREVSERQDEQFVASEKKEGVENPMRDEAPKGGKSK